MKELISVIVPVYKVEKYLNRCVDSILNQTYTNLEVILVDDGSPDSCPAICDEYAGKDKRVKVIHKPNAGVSAARNDGIAAANSEYITFIDSDDWIEPDYLQTLMSHSNDADYVCSGLNCWIGKDNVGGNIHNIISGIKVDKVNGVVIRKGKEFCGNLTDNVKKYFALFEKAVVLGPVAKIYKKSLIKDGFVVGRKKGEDVIFNIQYLQNCKTIKNIDYSGYNYECRNITSVTKTLKQTDKQDIQEYQNNLARLSKVFGDKSCKYVSALILLDVFKNETLFCISQGKDKKYIKSHLKDLYNSYQKSYIKNTKCILLKNKILLFMIKHKMFGLFIKLMNRQFG